MVVRPVLKRSQPSVGLILVNARDGLGDLYSIGILGRAVENVLVRERAIPADERARHGTQLAEEGAVALKSGGERGGDERPGGGRVEDGTVLNAKESDGQGGRR